MIILAAVLSTPATALDFKGVVMGDATTPGTLDSHLGPLTSGGDQHRTTIEDQVVFTKVTLDAGFVEGIDVEFLPYQFPVLETAAIRKWGKPASSARLPMQNGFGAQLTSRVREWRRDGFTVTLYEDDLDGKGWLSIQRTKAAKPITNADRM